MQHEMATIPVPSGGRVTTVVWFLPTSEFDAFCRDESVRPLSAETEDGTPFRFTGTNRAGVRVNVIEALGDAARVTADVAVRHAGVPSEGASDDG